MKYIPLLILFFFNFSFSQSDTSDEIFNSLNKKEKALYLQVFKNKDLKTPENYRIYLDSTLNKIKKSNKLYPLLLYTSTAEYDAAGNYKRAITGYNELIKVANTEEYKFLQRLSLLYKYDNQFEKSIEVLKRQIELDSKESIAYTNLANTYLLLNKFDEAFEVLQSNKNADKLDDDYKHYAKIYFSRNNPTEAKIQIDKYFETEFSKDDYRAYLIAAKIYSKLGKYEEVCKSIKAAKTLTDTMKTDKIDKNSILYKMFESDLQEIENIKNVNCK